MEDAVVKEENPAQGVEVSIKKRTFKKKEFDNRREKESRKELSFYVKEPKEKKQFKIELGGNDTEKVEIPSYRDHDQDEALLNLAKGFNFLVEDGDHSKKDVIETEETDRSVTASNRMIKLVAIK